ncbi:MAG: potassium-transporting ATPase subunit KdpA [Bdellovibrionales bacterium]|jgi:K+-transporting ATPase ATPase A chain
MSFLSLPLAWWGQVALFFTILLIAMKPLGLYMARVFEGEHTFLTPLMQPLENALYKLGGIDPKEEMGWKTYAASVLVFSLAGALVLFLFLLYQPFPDISADLALNIAASFVTNTNWQSYVPETTVTTASQMIGLAVQNFLSAAVGLAILIAFIRGLARDNSKTLGNFWSDLIKGLLYLLLPFAFLFALFLISQGVVQTFGEVSVVSPLDPTASQIIATGPVASQVAIKQLGTNGGGFFSANAAHPFENPTPLSTFLQMLAILLIPAASAVCFGAMTRRPHDGRALLWAMFSLLIPLAILGLMAEHQINPLLSALGVDPALGNMEGKEMRFGVFGSTLWASLTTATSSGSTNAALDSFMPLAGLIPLLFIHFGEVVFGGIGSGLCGLFVYVFLTVFIAGLMIGRSPEYLGKKIGIFDMKMVSLIVLIPAFLTLGGAALAVMTQAGQSGTGNPAEQGFSEILYALSSASHNNGSAFGGIHSNTPFYNILLGFCMLLGRYAVIVAFLALAGSMATKKITPTSAGTLDTASPLFIGLLVGTIVILSVLTFIPALSLGPVAAHFHLMAAGGLG